MCCAPAPAISVRNCRKISYLQALKENRLVREGNRASESGGESGSGKQGARCLSAAGLIKGKRIPGELLTYCVVPASLTSSTKKRAFLTKPSTLTTSHRPTRAKRASWYNHQQCRKLVVTFSPAVGCHDLSLETHQDETSIISALRHTKTNQADIPPRTYPAFRTGSTGARASTIAPSSPTSIRILRSTPAGQRSERVGTNQTQQTG